MSSTGLHAESDQPSTGGSRPDVDGNADVPALRLCGVTKKFARVLAVRDVDFDTRAGEIHALMGENGAGKTTLMRIAAGFHVPDGGRIEVDGRSERFRRPAQALAAGIGMVHQHFTLVPTLTVAENVALRSTRLPRRSRLQHVAKQMVEIGERLGFDVDPDKPVGDLTVCEQQRIEIIKLLTRDAKVLIFDEPSASLPPEDWERLAEVMRSLARDNRAIVLITHRIDDVFEAADRFTVLRHGAVTGHGLIESTSPNELVGLMMGGDTPPKPDAMPTRPGRVVLSVRDLTVPALAARRTDPPVLSQVSLEVHEHEIVGVAGLAHSGQQPLVETLVGLRVATAGEVLLDGAPYDRRTPTEFARHGGSYIPNDRRRAALAEDLTVRDNLLMREAAEPPIARHGIVRSREARNRAEQLIRDFDIRAEENLRVRHLSGGNQQKVVIARELSRHPKLIIAVEPVRGLDVNASNFVYRQLIARKRAGAAILLVSMDLNELFELSDRIVVMARGRIAATVSTRATDVPSVGLLMTRA